MSRCFQSGQISRLTVATAHVARSTSLNAAAYPSSANASRMEMLHLLIEPTAEQNPEEGNESGMSGKKGDIPSHEHRQRNDRLEEP